MNKKIAIALLLILIVSLLNNSTSAQPNLDLNWLELQNNPLKICPMELEKFCRL